MLPEELKRFQGIGQFGPAYRRMLQADSHAPGSVDVALLGEMVRLCDATAACLYTSHTPTAVSYVRGSRPELERIVAAWPPAGDDAQATVAALCQVAGLPARLVMLADTELAYSGHVIIEAFRDSAWGAVDTSTCVVYRDAGGRPATTWQLMNDPALIETCGKGKGYSNAGQFRAACIANYVVADRDRYDYTTSRVNDTYRSILEHSSRGWPGGLRWLHAENR